MSTTPKMPAPGKRWNIATDAQLSSFWFPGPKPWFWKREIAWAWDKMARSGYAALARDPVTGAIIHGGDWFPPDKVPTAAERRKSIKWWAKVLDPHENEIVVPHIKRVWESWHRWNDIRGWLGPNLSIIAPADGGISDAFRAWAGPTPPEAQPRPWYVDAWPLWAALGIFVMLGRR